MVVLAGNTAHFAVYYDDTLPNGLALANAILGRCEADLNTLAGIWVGTPVPAAFQVTIQPGPGGAFHAGTNITEFANAGTDAQGITALLVAEVDEVFMSTQKAALGKGFDPGFSHGEGLSRVLAAEVYPAIAGRFGVGQNWLNTNPRPDWVSNTELTDGNIISFGAASLFLNYLHYQLGFTWQQIVGAADNTLALVAQNLGVLNAYRDFIEVVARHYPIGAAVNPAVMPHDPEGFPIDNLYPLTCLYIRHNLADDGTTHTGALASSPDVIAKNAVVANPQATYSTAASIASDSESDPNVVAAHDNYVYLRVWNLGADAHNVSATAYWSPPATLVTPPMWNLIGHAQYPAVPAGRAVEVSSPGITWPHAAIPGPGHYCFVATVGAAGDPEPAPGNFADFNAIMAYILANSNITWRNFNVVAMALSRKKGPPHFEPLPFLITGAWDRPLAFQLEILADLPANSQLALDVPAWLGRELKPAPADRAEHEDADADPDDRHKVRIRLDPHGAQSLGQVTLPADVRAQSHLLVQLPAEQGNKVGDVVIRQLLAGQEVGRLTWRLIPRAHESRSEEGRE